MAPANKSRILFPVPELRRVGPFDEERGASGKEQEKTGTEGFQQLLYRPKLKSFTEQNYRVSPLGSSSRSTIPKMLHHPKSSTPPVSPFSNVPSLPSNSNCIPTWGVSSNLLLHSFPPPLRFRFRFRFAWLFPRLPLADCPVRR